MTEPVELMLVRLRARQPDGSVMGQRQRSCHLVPYPRTEAIPEYLTAYCGLQIAPGSAEVLPSLSGIPCEACMAHSPIPAFSVLRQFRTQIGGSDVEF